MLSRKKTYPIQGKNDSLTKIIKQEKIIERKDYPSKIEWKKGRILGNRFDVKDDKII